jgi:outer membrane receptor for ferrienterochelin and colicins
MTTGGPRGVCAGLALACLAALVGRPARAADVGHEAQFDEAQFHFTRGNQLYRQGRFDEALVELYASNRLVPNGNVQFNIARCLEQLKLFDEAFRAWSELARAAERGDRRGGQAAGSSGEREGAPPAERAVILAAIDRLRPQLALLEVGSEPPGAAIYLNRRDLGSLGTTPKRLALAPGQATVLLELPGYRPAAVSVALARGAERVVTATLERIYGGVLFRSLPPGAVVHEGGLDGPRLDVGPTPTRFVPGHHVVFVEAPEHVPARVGLDVPPDGTVTVDVPLAPLPSPTGAVIVRANVDGALVRIDGREMGFSPTVIEGVPAGERLVEVEHEGREPFRTRVVVEAGRRAYVDVQLHREHRQIEAANKRLTPVEDAPASITVVTAAQIRAFGYLTLAEALAAVRGVVASNDRTYEAIGFRGLSPPGDYTKRVLVLVDGHPYNDVVAGQGYVGHDLDVDLENVERIEVVRGAGSVLYGTGALFGVVNVVTRRPAPGAHAEAGAGIGTLGTQVGRATVSARSDAGELLASATAYGATGERAFTWSDGKVATLADGERARHADLLGRLGPLSLRAGFNDRTKTVPTGVFATRPEAGTTYRDERAYAELRLEAPLGGARLSARLAYDYGLFQGHYLQVTPPDTRDDFRSQWATGEARLELPALGRHRLTVGGEVMDELEVRQRSSEDPATGAPYFSSDTTGVVASGYLVDDWAPSERLRLNVGLRADDYTKTFGATLNPRVAVIARPYARGNTKLLLGRAFRAPSAYERFYNDMGATQVPAGPLSPETILSGELEHTHAFDDDLRVTVAAFAEELSNMVVLVSAPRRPDGSVLPAPRPEVFAFENLGDRVRGFGGEGEVVWEPGGGTFLSFSLAWHRTRRFAADGAHPLANAPTHVAALRFLTPLLGAALRLGAEVVVDVGRSTVAGDVAPDAALCNVTLSGDAHVGARLRLRYFGGLYNLLDERAGTPVGREVAAGATVAREARTARLGLALAF